jgi:DNA-binding XRE family transcriptional regulator
VSTQSSSVGNEENRNKEVGLREKGIPLPRLKDRRRRAALTQVELANLAGVSPSSIQALESGERAAHPRTVRRIAKAIAIEPQELME